MDDTGRQFVSSFVAKDDEDNTCRIHEYVEPNGASIVGGDPVSDTSFYMTDGGDEVKKQPDGRFRIVRTGVILTRIESDEPEP